MHLMLTNKGPTPMPFGTGQASGFEGLLPPGLEIPFARDDITTLVFGEQPEAAGRSKHHALRETDVDPDSPLALEYGTDIDQWKGRSDPMAEEAVMRLNLFIRNVGRTDVTVTTSDGPVTVKGGEGVEIWTIAGTVTEGEAGPGPGPDPDPDAPFDVNVTAFTATLDPTMTLSDASNVDNGDTVALTAVAGDPAAMSAIEGQSGAVYEKSGSTVRMPGIDLSAFDVTGLTATARVTPVPDTTGTINAFSQGSPTTAAMDAEDEALLVIGGTITLEALTGDAAAMTAINGQSVEVLSKSPVTLDLDLSAVDVAALTADFTVD